MKIYSLHELYENYIYKIEVPELNSHETLSVKIIYIRDTDKYVEVTTNLTISRADGETINDEHKTYLFEKDIHKHHFPPIRKLEDVIKAKVIKYPKLDNSKIFNFSNLCMDIDYHMSEKSDKYSNAIYTYFDRLKTDNEVTFINDEVTCHIEEFLELIAPYVKDDERFIAHLPVDYLPAGYLMMYVFKDGKCHNAENLYDKNYICELNPILKNDNYNILKDVFQDGIRYALGYNKFED